MFFPIWFPVHADGPLSTFFTHGLIVGLFAILGHVYPIYLRFKGGKVATSVGVVLGVNPILLLILAIIFFGVLYIFKYVSLSSIIAICCVIGSLIIQDYILFGMSLLVSIILIVRHRTNIVRIFKGEEPKIKWM